MHGIKIATLRFHAEKGDIQKGAFLKTVVIPFFDVFVDVGRGVLHFYTQLSAKAEGKACQHFTVRDVRFYFRCVRFTLFKKLG